MKRTRLTALSVLVACGATALTALPANAAKAGDAPAVTGKVKIKALVTKQCDGRNGSTARKANIEFTNVKVGGNGKLRVRQHFSGFEYARASDLDGRVTGRVIRGWLRNIDSDHGMGSGTGGTDCSTGKSRLGPPPESWVRFRGRSLPGKPRVFRVTAGKPESRPTGHYRGPGAKCAGRKADYVGTSRSDRIKAKPGSVVVGGGGDDHITGKNLTVCGGPGNDRVTITGGAGLVDGGAGDDVIEGGPGWDVLYGRSGNDVIRGGAGANTIYGGPGADILDGGEDEIGWIFGGPGPDQINGGSVIFG
ncbi:MAG: hypothetical protein M3Y45_10180 [Actinomycetota bacterium]|nr:hypothetical protein [Actinomycetota bacterium]